MVRALTQVPSQEDSCNCAIALPPSGPMAGYWKVWRHKKQDAMIVMLKDTPENILKRITLHDIDFRSIQRHLMDREKRLYRRGIKTDIAYLADPSRKCMWPLILQAAAPARRRATSNRHWRELDGVSKATPGITAWNHD
jgi:hypothetical protein